MNKPNDIQHNKEDHIVKRKNYQTLTPNLLVRSVREWPIKLLNWFGYAISDINIYNITSTVIVLCWVEFKIHVKTSCSKTSFMKWKPFCTLLIPHSVSHEVNKQNWKNYILEKIRRILPILQFTYKLQFIWVTYKCSSKDRHTKKLKYHFHPNWLGRLLIWI